jgi:PKD repeat protein
MWSVDSGAWQASGATVSNLSVGSHTVAFNQVQGWTAPSSQPVSIANGQTASTSGTYTPVYAAIFTASPADGKAPLTVHFTDKSVGSIKSWLWKFGDGTTSKTRNPSHTYSKAGTYAVTLTVTGPGGTNTCTYPDCITVYAAPKANFSAAPASGKAPLQVNFTDKSTGLVTGWLWKFGDGATSTDESPDHTYEKPGTYTAKLTVTGPGGSGTKTLSIRVTK